MCFLFLQQSDYTQQLLNIIGYTAFASLWCFLLRGGLLQEGADGRTKEIRDCMWDLLPEVNNSRGSAEPGEPPQGFS